MKFKTLTLALASMALATSSLNVHADNISPTQINEYLESSLKAMAKHKELQDK